MIYNVEPIAKLQGAAEKGSNDDKAAFDWKMETFDFHGIMLENGEKNKIGRGNLEMGREWYIQGRIWKENGVSLIDFEMYIDKNIVNTARYRWGDNHSNFVP